MFWKMLARVLPITDSRNKPPTQDGEDVGESAVEEPHAPAVFPGEEQTGALALLVALEALAPVTRASFLALRKETSLPDAKLVRALLILADAGLVEVENHPVGASARSFSLSEHGREVLRSPREDAGEKVTDAASAERSGRGATPLRLVEGAVAAGARGVGAQA